MKPVTYKMPWGTYQVANKLDVVRVARDQLLWMLKTKVSSCPSYTQADLVGYEEILALGHERTADRFLELKGLRRRIGERTTNAEAIAELKHKKKWGTP